MTAAPLAPDAAAADVHRILVVDDNPAIQEDFRKILGSDPGGREFDEAEAAFFGTAPVNPRRSDFAVDFAFQGKEALVKVELARAEGHPYSVVFMDIRMPPGWDGIETTQRLWEADPDLQVVICTAYSDYSWEEMIARLGRTDRLLILKKPFDVIEVVQCAHALTGKWALLQDSHRHAGALEAAVRERTLELEREVAERRRSEEALRLTQFSVDYASDAKFWAAPDGRLLYVNSSACRSLGYTAGELLERNFQDITPQLAGGTAWEDFRASLRASQHRTFETRCLAKDHREIPIELSASLFDFGGREVLCASARDITRRMAILEELARTRDAALESVRLKGQFLANMSHEIRTPMNGVIGMSELLLHTNLDRDQRDYVNTIRASADGLLAIINDILDSSKIDAGKLAFDSHAFDLREVVESALDVIAGTGGKKGLEIAGCVQPEVHPYLRGDSGRLRQVLTNIVSNAVKFTEEGEVVILVSLMSETESEARLHFEVRDTGIGIPAAALGRVFEPFVQVDGSDSRKYGGTGLGLAICRQLVEAMGGKIGVESEPGKGANFWFDLDFPKESAPPDRGPAEADCPTGLRVLVVDDNATNRHILRLQLANLHMRPEAVGCGDEALSLLRREAAGEDPFHLAVLDMQMPEMDGVELAGRIKAEPAIAATRLLILTSLGDNPAAGALFAAGVEGCLPKPIKQSRLHAALATILSRQPQTVPSMPVARPPGQDGAQPGDRPLRILLAEDNGVNQKVALLQLKSLGYSADLAMTGAEVLEALEKNHYDVILMDCQMPVMDGYSATREIRRIHNRPIRIIAMTANAMQGDREKCLAAGMDAYLSKPVNTEELGRLLDEAKQYLPASAKPRTEPFPAAEEPVDMPRLLEIAGRDPAMFRSLTRDYLEQADEILACIRLAIERRSPRDIHQLAHKLIGSSASCGMRAILEPLSRLERIREASQVAAAGPLHQEAVHQLNRIRRFLARQSGGSRA